jgi:purine nucleosidase
MGRFARERWLLILVAIIAIATVLVLTLAMPLRVWRTGREPVASLDLVPGEMPSGARARVWIDTDAACGAGAHIDADDCWALALLLKSREVRIVGISTVFGNAPLATSDRTTRELVQLLGSDVAVHRGAESVAPAQGDARDALRSALRDGPLTIVALGPLSNIAAALDGERELRSQVLQLIAVMGHRGGHLFHPTEGAGPAMLLGHGPIFRDFNFVKDEEAAARIVAMQLPMTLVPYDASREWPIGEADLNALAVKGGALKWIAERSRDWLAYWRKDIGQPGFYAFDLAAAAFVLEPDSFACARVPARVMRDRFWTRVMSARALIAGPEAGSGEGPNAMVSYCPQTRPALKASLLKRITGD